MKFNDSLGLATAHAYLVEWIPEDWPVSQLNPCKSYVVATSIDEATGRLTSNPADIKRVTVLGDIIERAHG